MQKFLKKNVSQKKILFAGGSHADIPQILEAKKKGYHVITTGTAKNDLGHKYADESFYIDYSNAEKILDISKKLNIDFICASANDFSQLTSAYVANNLNLPGYDSINTNKIIHHKDKFKSFCEMNNFPVAKQYNENDIKNISNSNFPIISKPTDLTGGKGISISTNIDELKKSVSNAREISRSKNVIIEQFIQGTNHAMFSIIKNRNVIFSFFDNEHYYINNFLVSGASSYSSVGKNIQDKIISDINRMASDLALVDGILHLQFKFNGSEYFFLEICRRPPGDLYTMFVALATGVNIPLKILNSCIGIDNLNEQLRRKQKERFILRHCLMSERSGIIKGIHYDDSIKNNIIQTFNFLSEGDLISDHMTDKVSILFLEFANKKEMDEKINSINTRISISF